MGKRPSLAETMRQAVVGPDPAAEVSKPIEPLALPSTLLPQRPSPPAPEQTARPSGFYAATRAGKKKVTAALDPVIHKRLKGFALEKDVTTEALLIEAINDLLSKHGKTSGR